MGNTVLLSTALSLWFAVNDKSYRRWWTISAALLLLGIACFIGVGLIGSHIDKDGFLHEPFALIPIGYLLSLAGLLSVLLCITRKYLTKTRQSN